jgi:hypothetical protein
VLGLYALAAPGITITGADIDGTFETNFGPGAGLLLGFAFNPTFTSYVSLDLARQGSGMSDIGGTFGLVHFEVGARANLPLGNRTTKPYVSASIGRRSLGATVQDFDENETYPITVSGMMFGLGGGIQHTLTPHASLDAGLELGFGRFSNVADDGEHYSINIDGSMSTRLRVGLTWRP